MKRDLPPEFTKSCAEMFSSVLKRALEENREFILHLLLNAEPQDRDRVGTDSGSNSIEDSWIPIDSISKLRGEVGGRFDTLKIKWQEAGLPLKQKKGDKIPEFAINPAAWGELEAWLLKMGYAVRAVEGKSDRIFEIKKML